LREIKLRVSGHAPAADTFIEDLLFYTRPARYLRENWSSNGSWLTENAYLCQRRNINTWSSPRFERERIPSIISVVRKTRRRRNGLWQDFITTRVRPIGPFNNLLVIRTNFIHATRSSIPSCRRWCVFKTSRKHSLYIFWKHFGFTRQVQRHRQHVYKRTDNVGNSFISPKISDKILCRSIEDGENVYTAVDNRVVLKIFFVTIS